MDGCNVLPETQFVGTRLRVDTTRVLRSKGRSDGHNVDVVDGLVGEGNGVEE